MGVISVSIQITSNRSRYSDLATELTARNQTPQRNPAGVFSPPALLTGTSSTASLPGAAPGCPLRPCASRHNRGEPRAAAMASESPLTLRLRNRAQTDLCSPSTSLPPQLPTALPRRTPGEEETTAASQSDGEHVAPPRRQGWQDRGLREVTWLPPTSRPASSAPRALETSGGYHRPPRTGDCCRPIEK